MVFLSKFFSSIFLAVVYASAVGAGPSPSAIKHETHRSRQVGRGLSLQSFHPPTIYKTFGAGIEQPASFGPTTIEGSAVAFVQSELGVSKDDIIYKSGYSAGSAKYAYLKQHHDGVPFANAVANVAWKGSKVVSFGSSFVKKTKIAPSKPTVDVKSAIPKAEEALDGKYNNHPASLEYLVQPDGSIALVHVVQIQNEVAGTWYEVFVDAHSGIILSVTDFVSDASYTVLPITKETLPEGLETLTNPQDILASPAGWHTVGSTNTTTTAGNNVVAYKSSQSATTSQSSTGLNFNYSYDTTQAPTVQLNVDAARVNAFYAINTIHDFAYRYGFTEQAFNFQANNFGKGGKENDRVLMSVQDASGTNNANFATPPDGQSGTCRMYVWTYTNPRRDGDMENDIIVHEMTHGITNRMTGGGTGRCLQTTEAGGMGEGWSDAMAEWTEQKSTAVPDYVLGAYVTNNPKGIRKYPYSTSTTTNPLRYSSIKALNEVHNIGEVWANMLHNVYAALVAQHGFSSTARTNPDGTQGNIVYLHLFLDALSLQPCNPTFVSARDAWIQADANRYGGANKCLLWKAFASRGLGVKAAGYVDDSSVPAGC
ncbi:Fungalysin metallopeptidase-domain-containing protein [Collybia nuda]|uniref:Extracellular metalloproteinase n=1 Tax=Collybia nuda TaxID=64659 RepID=A0A9P5YFP5_9AGAR|nr:Fungalysin metallopeptidase-domain-containing protein [Collybia nuda]